MERGFERSSSSKSHESGFPEEKGIERRNAGPLKAIIVHQRASLTTSKRKNRKAYIIQQGET